MNEHTDTRVTDYALGELDDAIRQEMQTRLAGDPEARRAAVEIELLSGLLRAATPQSPDVTTAPVTGPSVQATVTAHLQAAEKSRRITGVRRSTLFALAASLAVVVTGVATTYYMSSDAFRRPTALMTKHDDERAAQTIADARGTYGGEFLDSQIPGMSDASESMTALRIEDFKFGESLPPGTMGDGLISAETKHSTPGPQTELYAASPGAPAPSDAIKNGSGKLTINGANTYTGGTVVSAAAPPPSSPALPVINNPTPVNEAATGKFMLGAGVNSNAGVVGGLIIDSKPAGAPPTVGLGTANVYSSDLDVPVDRRARGKSKQAQENNPVDAFGRGEHRNVTHNTEAYDAIVENPFLMTINAPLSTFSIDVDTASYSNVRRMLNAGSLPPRGAVRLEEFINYFTYEYPQPSGDDPFAVTTEAARCPWNGEHVLVRVGLKGKEIHRKERPATNLVFLVDVSGSMQDANKLPLVRESLKLLVNELGDSDRVAMVVYAGSSGLVLPSTGGNRKQTILEAIDHLQAGGSTNGASGITLAYQVAAENFIKGGVNRVVLATDGDFNVGVTSQSELMTMIEEKARSGVFFSALGYGMGNYKDSTLEKLADKGNGNYAYIDTPAEARKVLVEQMSGTLVTIAKDVKIQIEFNPARVAAYRLLGYENRILAAEDFNDDKKDAGEIGAGHTVTALYELIPAGKNAAAETKDLPTVDPLKYQRSAEDAKLSDAAESAELLTLKLRYKQPDGDTSKLIERPLADDVRSYGQASGDFKFAASVAAFGMLLRHSEHCGSATFDGLLELAQEGVGRDEAGYRAEFVELVRKARTLSK